MTGSSKEWAAGFDETLSGQVDDTVLAMQGRITVIGNLNADLVQNVDRLPNAGETAVGGDPETFSRRMGANQAYAAGRTGAHVSMIGQEGKDSLASLPLTSPQSAGVDSESVGQADSSTDAALIRAPPDGANVLVISPAVESISERDCRLKLRART